MWPPLVTLLGAGIVAVVALAFWAELQNWMAGIIDRAQSTLGRYTHTLQSALVILDRIMVGGQRVVRLTGRVLFREKATSQVVIREEVRTIDVRALPTELVDKLEAGQSVSYDLSEGLG